MAVTFEWPFDPAETIVPPMGEHGPRWQLPPVSADQDGRPVFEAHDGIDLAVDAGTPVPCAADGTVSRVQDADDPNGDGEGNAIWIDHGGGLMTAYLHLSDPPSLSAGDLVTRGDVIGSVGDTGNTDGPHLCFQTLVMGVAWNPRDFLRRTE